MSNNIMKLCWPLQMPAPAKAVLMAIAWHADERGCAFPSLVTLGVKTSLGKTALLSAITWLEDNRVLVVQRGGSVRGGTKFSNKYALLLDRLDPALFPDKPRRPSKPVRDTDQSEDGDGENQFVGSTGSDDESEGNQSVSRTGQDSGPVRDTDRSDAAEEEDQFAARTGAPNGPVRLADKTGPSDDQNRSVSRTKPVRQTDPKGHYLSVKVSEPSSACAREDEFRLTAAEVDQELIGFPTVPYGMDREVLARFVRHRRVMRRALTISAWMSMQPRLRELVGDGHDLNESLRQTMEAGLVLPVTPTTRGNTHAQHGESAADRVRRLAEEGDRRDAEAEASAAGSYAVVEIIDPDAVGSHG